MIILLKNKKSVVFSYLMSLFMIVIIFTSLTFFINKPKSDINQIKYGEFLEQINLEQKVYHSYKFTAENTIKTVYELARRTFLNFVVAQSSFELFNCQIGNELILYDARNKKDTDLDVYNNCLEILTQKEVQSSNTLNYEEIFTQVIEVELNSTLKNLLKDDFEFFDIVPNVIFNEETNSLSVDLYYNLNISSTNTQAFIYQTSSFDFDLGSFTQMLENLIQLLPTLETQNINIENCILSNTQKNKENCSIEIIELYLKNELTADFLYTVEYIREIDSNYFQLRITVKENREFGNDLITFNVILEEQITLGYPDFSLKIPNFDQRLLQIEIQTPTFSFDDFEGYLVLYSYENFIEDENLLQLLSNSLLEGSLKNFNSLNSIDINNYEGLNYSIFVPNEIDDITALYLDKSNIKKNNTTLTLYQIFNHSNEIFSLLEDREIFVFVFNLKKNNDNNYQYLINNELMLEKIKKSKPSKLSALPPIDFSLNNIANNLGVNFGFEFSFSNYVEEYDNLKVFFSFQEEVNYLNCIQMNNCFEITVEPPQKSQLSYLIVSNISEINVDFSNQFDFVVDKKEIFQENAFENNLDIYVLIVANSQNRKSFLEINPIRNYYSLINTQTPNYFTFGRFPQTINQVYQPKKITLRELTK